MTEIESKIWELVNRWADQQSTQIPDFNRRYLMDKILELINQQHENTSKIL